MRKIIVGIDEAGRGPLAGPVVAAAVALLRYVLYNKAMKPWDYNIAEDWQPKTERQWLWYLERKINYGDWHGLKKIWIQKYWPQLQRRLDPGKRQMLDLYLNEHG